MSDKQVYNPYLPLTEYVPDGEPHLFDGRVYIYGSHDAAHADKYCVGHYVTWSAPENNLKDWRYEGVIYKRDQDPSNADDKMQLWAPDVTKGPDGRYYLYYCFAFYPEIGVAVSDSPAGPFSFYGHVKYPSHILGGKTLQEYMPFDPAIFTDEDGRVYLYYGFAPGGEKKMVLPKEEDIPDFDSLPEEEKKKIRGFAELRFSEGSMVAELEPDMITLKEIPHVVVPGEEHSKGTSFEGHGFFEASSIRRVGEKYYFVYSSHKSHDLCYAVSDYPDKDFVYGGILVSSGDIGLNGRKDPVNTLGNNHGGMVCADGQWYVFYQRQTAGTEFSRQGCAEPICLKEDGSIDQVEITSCGLNNGPLKAEGTYPAAIACHLTSQKTLAYIDYSDPVMLQQTRIVQSESDDEVYITSVEDNTKIGYKYFDFKDTQKISLKLRGAWKGKIGISTDEKTFDSAGEIDFDFSSDSWDNVEGKINIQDGTSALYFTFRGEGSLEFLSFSFE